ncbi:MAG: hypothetical protein LPJ98_14740, partial [Cyclobacteriaceae bacterium]|nr:hypothetical protein [Cyclobacteriaceae bacterium]
GQYALNRVQYCPEYPSNAPWIIRFDLRHQFQSNSATSFGSNCSSFLSRISIRIVPLSGLGFFATLEDQVLPAI